MNAMFLQCSFSKWIDAFNHKETARVSSSKWENNWHTKFDNVINKCSKVNYHLRLISLRDIFLNSFIFIFTGCLLDGVTPSAPPDVPPRNPTMNRMNGRGNPNDLNVDFEPSCLVRTPSGNVYIPSGNLSKYKYWQKAYLK